MEARAILRNVPTSPRKMRLVADMIRGQKVSRALAILQYQPQAAAPVLKKVLMSAVANWQQLNEDVKLEDAELYVKTVFVDGGTMLKRLRPAPQGRAYRVRKRSNHITLVVDDASAELIQQEA
ncbi:50S ribosomal protein L22 [Runella sp. SP2]|uniref:50S ribosomal protein L22 n=1 Tax=Runella sp. SP2 TaxID=2268026 RepID=UPI000F0740F5|nr:50S ribosomal protein L22 [Runella sp. SP2]AYQ34725.1 50S ribosomal protein L22 [Runella sp. SP2]